MNYEFFIARRLFFSRSGNRHMSQRIVRLAVAAIALGLSVMILAVAIVIGFKGEIKTKVSGLAAHLHIVRFDNNQSFLSGPVTTTPELQAKLMNFPGVTHVQKFATKPGMIRVNDETQGVVLKGIGADFDWRFFEKSRVEGQKIRLDSARTDDVWISQQLSLKLRLRLGDSFRMYFLNEGEKMPRIRQFNVGGIYRTGLEEFDLMFVLGDLRHLQRLNSWDDNQAGGYEVYIENMRQKKDTNALIRAMRSMLMENNVPVLRVVNVQDKFPQIFDWLRLLDMNVWIILLLMVLVAGFNMISGLLVIILERTQMIGILKSMGMSNAGVRKVFLNLALLLTGKGLLLGNVIGISLCLVQHYFGVIPLDPAQYNVSTVPVVITPFYIAVLNGAALLAVMLMLVGPSYVVGRISPEKTVRFM